MPDTTLVLGDFEFARFEIPEQIGFGGDQKLVVHELVGGTRTVDAMGEVPRALEWSGFFVGASGLDRALYVDGLRKAGKSLSLTWSELSYTVVIQAFHCEFVRAYRLPYRITCEVVSDDTAPITDVTDPSPEQLVSDDMDTVSGYGAQIGDDTLTGLLGALSTNISAVGSFSSAAPSALSALLTPLNAVRTQAQSLLASATGSLDVIPGVGGALGGASVIQQVASLGAASSASDQSATLIALDRTLGRMAANIGSVNAGTAKLTVAGGNLFQIASSQYGDATGWTAIAQANGLSDPQIDGIATLSIPPLNIDAGGVLNG